MRRVLGQTTPHDFRERLWNLGAPPFDGLRFTVLEASANRIVTVRIQKPAA